MSQAVASRYAQAFFELAQEKNLTQIIGTQLQQAVSIFGQSKEFRTTMLNPSIELDERKAIMEKIAQKYQWHRLTLNFSLLLLDKDRFDVLPEIQQGFQKHTDKVRGLVRASVTSATELSLLQQSQIKKALSKLNAGANIELQTEVDPELIGGVVARVGGRVYDGSVKTQLERIRQSILSQI